MTDVSPSPENLEEILRSLRRKEGNWVAWGQACQKLQKSGYSPQAIFEETGFEPIQQNQVIVGDRTEAQQTDCTVQRVNWVSIAAPTTPIHAEVQIRYRSTAVGATIIPLEGERVKVVFNEPQFSVTPGQAAVWYDGDVLLGGGIIESP